MAETCPTLQPPPSRLLEFVRWYNVDRRLSGIRYVSLQRRHAGDDHAIPAARHTLRSVQATPPGALVWNTRHESHIDIVTLNPERKAVVNMAANAQHSQLKAV